MRKTNYRLYERAKAERLHPGDEAKLFPVKEKEVFKEGEADQLKANIPAILVKDGRMTRGTKQIKLMQEVLEKVIDALTVGSSLEVAANFAGIKPAQLKEWLARGHASPRSAYGAFLKVVQEAVAKCDVNDLKALTVASEKGEWEASVARLKLRNYGQSKESKEPVHVTIVNYGNGTQEISVAKPKEIEVDYDEVT